MSIVLLGPADTMNEKCNIINPMSLNNAIILYGEDSDLAQAYKQAYAITGTLNIFTVNCQTVSDYINIIDDLIQYDFTFIVPIGIYLSDTFYDPSTQRTRSFVFYYLEALKNVNSLATLIMTDKHAELYEDIDDYLTKMKKVLNTIKRRTSFMSLLTNYGSNLLITLNMLKDIKYSNVILSALLASCDLPNYPKSINYTPVYDLDINDLTGLSDFIYFKYNYMTESTSIENLVNCRTTRDIYKNAMIDMIIKKVIKVIDLNEYKGKLYNAYTKLQISNKITNVLKPYINKLFKSYELINIGFVKTGPSFGYIYIELSIIPFGSIEELKVVMEV
jgi:hypothetical protein